MMWDIVNIATNQFLFSFLTVLEMERTRLPFSPILTPLSTSWVTLWGTGRYLMDCIHCYKKKTIYVIVHPCMLVMCGISYFCVPINFHGWLQHDIHNFIFNWHTLFGGCSAKKCVTSSPICSPDTLSYFESDHFVQSCVTSVMLSGLGAEVDLTKGLWFDGKKMIQKAHDQLITPLIDFIYCEPKIIFVKKVNSCGHCACLLFLWYWWTLCLVLYCILILLWYMN